MKTTSNRHLINLTFIICTVLFSIALSSCDLFINEEPVPDDYGFSDVPEHTGEGYDKPVTTIDNGCEVTYQLQSNVRQLTMEDTQRWITYVEQDATGLFLEIRYSANTPKDRLPVLGEILLSNDIQRFPTGCMHRVQMRELRNGEYCYIASLAELKETYKELDINGAVMSQDTEEFTVAPEPDDSIASDSLPAATRMTTRGQSDEAEFNIEGLQCKIGGGKTEFNFNLGNLPKFSTQDRFYHTAVTFGFNEGSHYNITHKLNFDNFSLSDGVYKIKAEKVEDVVLKIKLEGSVTGSFKIKHFRPVKGKPFVIGPVVVVLFVNLNFDFEIDCTASGSIERSWKTTTTYDLDLEHPTDIKKSVVKNYDTDWRFHIVVAGDVGIRATLEIGLGLYGKILSLRVCPSVFAGVHGDFADMIQDEDGKFVYAIEDVPGITPKIEWQIQAGIYLELDLLDWFKSLFGSKVTTSNTGAVLGKITEEARNQTPWYKEMSAHDASNYWHRHDMNYQSNREEEDNSSLTFTLGPWPIAKHTMPWFPAIKDNSFKIEQIYDEQKQKMVFVGSYVIRSIGFFGYGGQSYIPSLLIKKGTRVVDEIFPDGDGTSARVKNDRMYTFTLPNYENDVTYMACPSYHSVPLVKKYSPDMIDKGLPFMGTTPSATISKIKPTYYSMQTGPFVHNNKTYNYKFICKYDLTVTIKGAENIGKYGWGVKEMNYQLDHPYKSSSDAKLRDGTYVLHCKNEILSNIGAEIETSYGPRPNYHELILYPYFFTDEMTGTEVHSGPIVKLTLYTEGGYSVDGGKKLPFTQTTEL